MPRLIRLAALAAIVAAGYWLRFYAPVDAWLRDASGGALYVVAWAVGLSLIRPHSPARLLALAAFLLTCFIEFSQAWRGWMWLNQLRATRLGRLALGTQFNWLDFPPYFAGWLLAVLVLLALARIRPGGATKKGRVPHRRPRKASR